MPINYKDYPANWKTEIVPTIRNRSGNVCEGSPKYPDCRAENKKPHQLLVVLWFLLPHISTITRIITITIPKIRPHRIIIYFIGASVVI
jgi:hypothetical protein